MGLRTLLILASLLLAAILPLASAHPGVGIVVDRSGNVFYTDLAQVWKIAPDGKRTVAVPNVHTHELYLDPEGNLFGEHVWYEGDATGKWGFRVWKLSADGKLEDVIPATQGFLGGYSFVRDAHANMYWAAVSDTVDQGAERVRIKKRAPDGTISTLAGEQQGKQDGVGRAARFTNLRWLAVSAEGVVYAIDDGDLRRIAADGTVTTLARELDERNSSLLSIGKQHYLMGLCPTRDGSVYVANHEAGRVEKFAPDGKADIFSRSTAPFAPTGVTTTPNGDVFILEYAGSRVRVRKVGADGTERVL